MARNALAAALALLALLIVPAGAAAAISSIADAPTWTIGQQPVEAFAPDGDRAWVGGNFINAGPRTGPGAAVDLAGNRIAGYAELTDSTGGLRVDAVTDDGAGGWYVAGTFTQAAGIARPGLVHLNADGSVDTAFNAQATAGTVRVLTRDGALLYVGGTFISIGGQTRSRLAALDAATGADTGWDAAVSAGGIVNSIAVDGGFAWVGGNFTAIGATAVNNAAKVLTGVGVFNADGSWVPQPTATVRAVLATATDIYLGGDFTTVSGTTSPATNHVSKVDRTLGAPDAAWAPNANGSVLALVSDGTTLYAGGSFTSFGGATRRGTAATPLASAGLGAATSWYPGDLNQGGNVQTLALSGSTVYIGGSFTKFAGGPRAGLAAAPTTGTG
ncbi:MAG: trimeric autotransporter adhesin, partial [Thermoleophilaceae bacterium]|nr:trimeric autotransporter adhesin [Thermoleophilaceae bacterium]